MNTSWTAGPYQIALAVREDVTHVVITQDGQARWDGYRRSRHDLLGLRFTDEQGEVDVLVSRKGRHAVFARDGRAFARSGRNLEVARVAARLWGGSPWVWGIVTLAWNALIGFGVAAALVFGLFAVWNPGLIGLGSVAAFLISFAIDRVWERRLVASLREQMATPS